VPGEPQRASRARSNPDVALEILGERKRLRDPLRSGKRAEAFAIELRHAVPRADPDIAVSGLKERSNHSARYTILRRESRGASRRGRQLHFFQCFDLA
jgi:hypothetical protein